MGFSKQRFQNAGTSLKTPPLRRFGFEVVRRFGVHYLTGLFCVICQNAATCLAVWRFEQKPQFAKTPHSIRVAVWRFGSGRVFSR